MTKEQISAMLQQAFEASLPTRSVWDKLQDKTGELSATRARALEFTDRAEDLARQIEKAEAELYEMSPLDISFDVLSAKRRALRELQGDYADIMEWIDKLSSETRRLTVEQLDIKRELSETIHGEVMEPVLHSVNDTFVKLIVAADSLIESFTSAWASFRSRVGGTASPKLKAKSNAVVDALEGF